jgi:hypothetical protein
MASLRRAFGMSGRSYVLTRAREVVAQVTTIDSGRCHVQLLADLGNTFTNRLTASGATVVTGGAATGIGLVIGVPAAIAAAPVALAVLVGFLVARGRRGDVEKVQVALEQILDRLEHGEIGGGPQLRGPRASAFVRIADELLKNLGPGTQGGSK